MADQPVSEDGSSETESSGGVAKPKPERRKIPGNLPYTAVHGALKKALGGLPASEKPPVFNTDFLDTVLQIRGGSNRPIPPIMKAMGFLDASGAPTNLYSQFQTEAGRPNAALQALKNGYAEIFRRNQYAHRADEPTLIDLIVAITGLPKSEPIVRNILRTFQVVQAFAAGAGDDRSAATEQEDAPSGLANGQAVYSETPRPSPGVGLVYNINVVLPETTNVEVYNAIFRSLKGNLLS
jgi:hypothetical protein